MRHPAGVAHSEVVEHAAEPVRTPGEHERLELQHRIEQPDRCQHELECPLKVLRLLAGALRDPLASITVAGASPVLTSVMLIAHLPWVGVHYYDR